jgi:polygalacturonase
MAADRIVASVRRPRFPRRVFPVTRFGAAGDGTTKNTSAFRAAIAAAHRAGGGQVLVPGGTFLTGAIHLLSNVDLHLEKGATIAFSQDPADYLPVVFTRWQGIELMNYSPFIYSYGQRNIAVTGEGTLDGQADANHWWNWKPLENADFSALETMADDNVPVSGRVFGDGHHLPPQMIQPFATDTVLLQGVTVINSPFWHLNPNLCRNVTVEGADDPLHGPEHRRLRPGVLRRGRHQRRDVQHRRRLHRDQGGPGRRRTAGRRAVPERRRAALRLCRRARRHHHRQRDDRRRAERLRARPGDE